MNKKKLQILSFLLILSLGILCFMPQEKAQAQAGTAYEVLAEINALRAAYGLDGLAENQYLNLAAQIQADYIAATGVGSHTGEGGTTAYDRALSVGYGGGAQIWVTENWAKGYSLTAYDCVHDMWEPSTDHINNMLTTWHNEFGAGVALDINGMTVYVVNFGHSSGSSVVQPTTEPYDPTLTSTPSGPTDTPEPLIQPVTTTTPNADGSVTHVVQYGQTLYKIAEAYGISLANLLEMNGLTEDSTIYPGDVLLIFPASIETEETAAATATPEVQTSTPSSTPTEVAELTPTEAALTPTRNPNSPGSILANIFSGDTLWVGIGLIAVSVFGIVLLLFTSARLR
jgi:uncharacterized protein YkwD